MPLTLAAKLKLAAAAAILSGGFAAAALVPVSSTKFSMDRTLKDAVERGDYLAVADRARARIRWHPRDLDAHGTLVMALAMADRMDQAREAFEEGKRTFPELVKPYAETIEKTLDQIESGHRIYREGLEADADALPGRAARKYAEAYELLNQDPRVGLKAAEAWAAVGEPVKAAVLLHKLAKKGDPAAVKEARRFREANGTVLATAAVEAVDEGWKALDAPVTDEAAATKAREAFERAIALRPDHAALADRGVAPMRSPYLGLAASLGSSGFIEKPLLNAASNGMPAPSGTLTGRSGIALGQAMCLDDNADALADTYGERAKAWAEGACARATADREWQEAVDAFDKANGTDITAADALEGFQALKGTFSRDWDARFPVASYLRRTTCNVTFLEAWQAAGATPVDTQALDKALAASAACPTDDFSVKKLNERVAGVRDAVAKRDGFTLKVCNRSSKERVRIAYMRAKPGAANELALKGWWDLDKGKCRDLPATYAGSDEADLYLTANSDGTVWWPVETADTSACVPAGKVERTSEPGEIACGDGEDAHGFMKLTARRQSGKSGVTYNLKDPG